MQEILTHVPQILQGLERPLMYVFGTLAFAIILFEFVLPRFFGKREKVFANSKDFFIYTVGLTLFNLVLGFFVVKGLNEIGYTKSLSDISHMNLILQIIIMSIFLDFLTYTLHYLVHRYNIPVLSKAHSFHHRITDDMDWVNARKESIIIMILFTVLSTFVLRTLFESSPIAVSIVVNLFLILSLFSHYRIHISIPYLDYIFLFPKDHFKHHTIRGSGPYGLHLTIFDTIFNTKH